jgi:hypothetical protein
MPAGVIASISSPLTSDLVLHHRGGGAAVALGSGVRRVADSGLMSGAGS